MRPTTESARDDRARRLLEPEPEPASPPSVGTATGEEVNGGRNWQWTRVTGPSPEARILQIDIAVVDEMGGHAADLTIFRFAAQ